MNELIEVRFEKGGRRLRVRRQTPGGLEFEESEALERTVGIAFNARAESTRARMASIARVQGWNPGEFKLNVSVEDGSLVLRGVDREALPAGFYAIRCEIEDAKTVGGPRAVDVEQDKKTVVTIEVKMEDRTIDVDLARCDPQIAAVLARSTVDGVDGTAWVQDGSVRATRRACMLNVLASIRSRPTLSAHLLSLVHDVFLAANDRIYAAVDRTLLDRLNDLVADPDQPFFAEGRPNAPIHARLLAAIPEPIEVRARFGGLLSFRGEGRPSMQAVIAVPPADLTRTYVDFDLDLGNPLQDVLGFVVHVGELLDGKPTNHLDLRKALTRTKAGQFLCYAIRAA